MNSEMFVKQDPTRLFFSCAAPAVALSVFGALYSTVDGFFVGRFLGEAALAAVSLTMPVIMIVESVASMIAAGASVNASIMLGEGKREEASRVFSFSVKLIIALSCAIGLLGFLFAHHLVALLAPNASQEALHQATQYLKVYSLFAPLVPIYFALDNFLRVCGKQNLGMVIGISSQLANVALTFVLVAVLRQGIEVAAFAIVMYVDGVIGVVGFGLCEALQPAISHCHGAGLHDRVRAIFKRVLIAMAVTSFMTFLVMLLAGPSLASVFIKEGDEALLKVSAEAIAIFSFSYLVGWVDMCLSSYFTALDRPGRSLAMSIFGSLAFPLLALFALTPSFGLVGAWLAWPVASLASCILALVLFKTMRRARRCPCRGAAFP